jgi:hypothetical protein
MSGYIGQAPVVQATQTRQSFTATYGQTSFSTLGYQENHLDVFLNGVKLNAADYTATNNSDIVLAAACEVDDILEMVAFGTFEVANQSFTGTTVINTLTVTNDGTGSNIDADQLDGQHGAYYTGYTDTQLAALVDSSPAALNTLNELAAALGDDANFSTTVTNSIATKLPLAGGALTGALTTNSTIDGRDVAADGVTADAALPKAGGALTGNVTFGDGNRAIFGADTDMQLFHNGSSGTIANSTGSLVVRTDAFRVLNAANSEQILHGDANGAVTLYHDNAPKLATTSTGISVTGALAATAPNANGNAVFTRSGTSESLTIGTYYVTANGNDLQLNTTANATIDAGGDIILDADGGNINFKDAGTSIFHISNDNSGDVHLESQVSDKDLYIRGNDGGSIINAVYFDMSAAGAAVFNSTVTATGFSGKIYSTNGNTNYYLQLKDTNELNFFNANGVSDTIHINYDGGNVDIAKGAILARNAGAVTKPYQPAFMVHPASTQADIAPNGLRTVVFGTERFDIGGNFASNTFTAPVTGKYQLNVEIRLDNVDTVASYYHLYLATTLKTYHSIIQPLFTSDVSYMSISTSVLANMDAGDTAYVGIYQANGTQQTDISVDSNFSGFLAC